MYSQSNSQLPWNMSACATKLGYKFRYSLKLPSHFVFIKLSLLYLPIYQKWSGKTHSVFWPEEFLGLYSHWVTQSWTWLRDFHSLTHTVNTIFVLSLPLRRLRGKKLVFVLHHRLRVSKSDSNSEGLKRLVPTFSTLMLFFPASFSSSKFNLRQRMQFSSVR